MKDQKENSNSNFVEREWNEEIKGEYDEDGFFITPNGSFWDPDYVYFNREGYDKHGGRYNDNGEYIPGKGWDNENNCYESEKEEDFDEFDDEGKEGFHKNFDIGNEDPIDDLEDDIFDMDINDDNIQQIIKECSPFNNKDDEKKEEKEEKEEEKVNEEVKEEETPKEDKREETAKEDNQKEEKKKKNKYKRKKKKKKKKGKKNK